MHAPIFLLLAMLLAVPAYADRGDGMPSASVIRDAEIENTLKTLAEPIWIAAGLNPASVRVILINDNELNAFVAGGMNIFLHTGLINTTDNVNQLVGVIAHESGHISGGHLVRGRAAMKEASAEAILGMVLGTAAAVLSGQPGAGAAIITGGQSFAQRSVLSFNRAQESSADAAGMHFLDTARLSSKGLMQFLEKLSGQELLPVDRQAEYIRTHPLTRDRIDTVRNHVEISSLSDNAGSSADADRYERMKAKLTGYLKPDAALLRYADNDPRLTARYARAIAYYRKSNAEKSLKLIDKLLAEEPSNAYFHELKGQVLFENSRVKEAVPEYAVAVKLKPDAGLIEAAYGHALLEAQDAKLLDEAIQRLNHSLKSDPRESATWRLLATAWGRKENEGMVAYCLAEEALTNNDSASGRKWAERALKLLPKNSPYALRAQDIKQNHADEDKDD